MLENNPAQDERNYLAYALDICGIRGANEPAKGPIVADFLDQKRREIENRLAELKPLIAEHNRLQAAAEALSGAASSSANGSPPVAPARRGPGRPRGSKNRRTATAKAPRATPSRVAGRGGRRKGTGKRAAEALAAITAQPGITVPELVSKIKVNQTYLYRVLPGLREQGKISKQGRGWHPTS